MKYYFLGIGGISMSALAVMLKKSGQSVAGSDSTLTELTRELEKEGISVFSPPNLDAVKDADVVVVSSAINEGAELELAKALGKIVLSRGQLLSKISQNYKHDIAISGAHGKTTTTALIGKIFEDAGLDPTIHVGGLLCQTNKNYRLGGSDFFITEACEYKDNFLNLQPDMGIILNVEAEHLDYFKSYENVKKSFLQFAQNSKNLINLSQILPKNLNFSCKNYKQTLKGITFDCFKSDQFYAKISCPLYGRHNEHNILVAIACADFYKIDKEQIVSALSNFGGVKRRFEKRSFYNGSTLIFDYAHHPTEIKKTIEVAKSLCRGNLYIIFQPHTYSRTKAFFDQFVQCLSGNNVTIFKTYSARESFDEGGDGKTLALRLGCSYSQDYSLLKSYHFVKKGDMVLVLGAGDFYDKCIF